MMFEVVLYQVRQIVLDRDASFSTQNLHSCVQLLREEERVGHLARGVVFRVHSYYVAEEAS